MRDLSVDYIAASGPLRAVDAVSFQLRRGEILGLAGESGSGKSTLLHALLRTLGPPGVITGGAVRLLGQDVLGLDERALRALRWRRAAIVFQSAMDALNPVLTVGEQLVDTLVAHEPRIGKAARGRAAALLELVGLEARHLGSFPHELSGGMRQRAVIAVALALRPEVLLLDEPTTALDVVVERQILGEILRLREELGFSVLFITHDLPLMLDLCDRVGVLYGGRLAELGPAEQIRRAAVHPYTRGLVAAFPSLDGPKSALAGIPGTPPSLRALPPGCRFAPRCTVAEARCGVAPGPELVRVGEEHVAACVHAASPPPPGTPATTL
ncbi:MAG: ABC transporter ATP-binding protein [Myxococcales bacterium]|nr:ABC transporter ATP-binding protein [Myxococcales bacterium]